MAQSLPYALSCKGGLNTNVNQFEMNKSVGSATIEPPRDAFTTRKKVDANYELGTTAARAEINTKSVSSQGNENFDGGL